MNKTHAMLAIAFGCLSLGAFAIGCQAKERCHAMADHSVIACVDDDPVLTFEVQTYVRAPSPVAGTATLPDARRVALDSAIRTHLFAAEARRRSLSVISGAPPSEPAALAQALIADEMLRRKIGRDAVSDDEAARYFEAHPESFGQIDAFRAQAIVTSDAAAAERLYVEALGSDDKRFGEIAARASIDAASKDKAGDIGWIHADPDADPALLMLGLTLRRPGAVGGPVRAKDGRFYVLRMTEVPLEHPAAWDEAAKAKAKNLIVLSRRDEALDGLAAELLKKTRVRVFEDAVAAISVPSAGKR